MKKWIAATKNPGKIREIRKILEGTDIEVVSMEEIGITVDVEEDGTTFEENARKKATEIYKLTGLPCLSDDSGLEVDALGGAPGVYSARYAGGHDDDENNLKLLREMEGKTVRTARYVCALVLVIDDQHEILVRGECEGEIGFEMKGENGFGYDVLFYLPQYGKNMAEISDEEKNAISHRGKALRELRKKVDSM